MRGADRGASLLSSALLHLIVPEPDHRRALVECFYSGKLWSTMRREPPEVAEGCRQVLRMAHQIKRRIASRSRSATISTNMIEYAQEL